MTLCKQLYEIIKSGQLSGFRADKEHHLGGKYVRMFEDMFCDYFGTKYAISFNSATSALHAALIACDIGFGDEVITTPMTFSATASSIIMAGAKPVFVDIKADIFCIDPFKVWSKVACSPAEMIPSLHPHAKAIIPVHLHGHPADMTLIIQTAQEHKLKVIEDCSQAIGATYGGAKVGKMGDCGIFSFNQWKHINTGEGGMLITNNDEIARKARLVRNHGETQSNILGYNYRMTELTAVVGIEQFKRLDKILQDRIELCERMTEGLSEIEGLTPPKVYPNCRHVYCTYPVAVDSEKLGMTRDELQVKLLERGIYFGKGGIKPLHLFPFYGEGQFRVAEWAWKNVMFTDIFKPPMTLKDVSGIIKIVKEIIK